MRKLVVRLLLLATLVTILYACREPTQVTVRLTTDATCGGVGFREAAIAVASESALPSRAPTALTDACSPGGAEANIGTIVVVPSDENDDSFAVRVVAGIGISAEACPAPTYVLGPEETAAGRGCIVARRSLAFLPHTELELPIVLRQSCLNVDCDADETCVDGACISARVDPNKCSEPGGCDEDDLVGGGSGVGGAGGVGGSGGSGASGGAGGATVVRTATSIAVGDSYSCAIAQSRAWCWGLDDAGAWGIDDMVDIPRGPTEVMTEHAGEIAELAAGRQHMCMRSNDGTVECAGDNSVWQLGDDPAAFPQSFTPLSVPLGESAQQLAAGANHTCAVLSNTVSCWGSNNTGQVKLPPSPGELPFDQPIPAAQVASGVGHNCLAELDQTVQCWGDSTFFQVGAGNSAPVEPTVVMRADTGGDLDGAAVSAGAKHSCAIDTSAAVSCWGTEDADGLQFGDGPGITPNSDDAELNGVSGVQSIVTRENATCVVAPGGGLRCWGAFAGPVSIDGTQGQPSESPISIQSDEHVVQVAVGKSHACFLDDLGHVYCWGNNISGQVNPDLGGGPVFPPVRITLP